MGFMKCSKNKTTLATKPKNEFASVSFHLLGALVPLCVTTALQGFGEEPHPKRWAWKIPGLGADPKSSPQLCQ